MLGFLTVYANHGSFVTQTCIIKGEQKESPTTPYYAFQWSFQSDFSLVLYNYSTQQNTMDSGCGVSIKITKKCINSTSI